MDSLDDVLQDPEVDEPETVESPEETTGEEDATPAEEHEAEQQPEENREVAAFKAQAIDERRKRQALEQRLKELESQKPEIKDDDYWDNPKDVIQKTRTDIENSFNGKLYAVTEELTRDAYEDYDEMVDYFVQNLADQNPGILETARAKANPHRYIYQETKKLRKLAEIGDIDKYEQTLREKIAAEERAKIEAEFANSTRKTPPGSLANERAAGKGSTQANSDTLEDIFGR